VLQNDQPLVSLPCNSQNEYVDNSTKSLVNMAADKTNNTFFTNLFEKIDFFFTFKFFLCGMHF